MALSFFGCRSNRTSAASQARPGDVKPVLPSSTVGGEGEEFAAPKPPQAQRTPGADPPATSSATENTLSKAAEALLQKEKKDLSLLGSQTAGSFWAGGPDSATHRPLAHLEEDNIVTDSEGEEERSSTRRKRRQPGYLPTAKRTRLSYSVGTPMFTRPRIGMPTGMYHAERTKGFLGGHRRPSGRPQREFEPQKHARTPKAKGSLLSTPCQLECLNCDSSAREAELRIQRLQLEQITRLRETNMSLYQTNNDQAKEIRLYEEQLEELKSSDAGKLHKKLKKAKSKREKLEKENGFLKEDLEALRQENSRFKQTVNRMTSMALQVRSVHRSLMGLEHLNTETRTNDGQDGIPLFERRAMKDALAAVDVLRKLTETQD